MVDLPAPAHAGDAAHGAALAVLFAEELGLVLEVPAAEAAALVALYTAAGVGATVIGKVRVCVEQSAWGKSFALL